MGPENGCALAKYCREQGKLGGSHCQYLSALNAANNLPKDQKIDALLAIGNNKLFRECPYSKPIMFGEVPNIKITKLNPGLRALNRQLG